MPLIEYQRAFCRGTRQWRLLRSMNAKRTAEQLFRVHDLGFTVPLQASLHLSVGAFFTCGFSLTFQRSCPEPAVQPSRRLQKLNNLKSQKLGPRCTQNIYHHLGWAACELVPLPKSYCGKDEITIAERHSLH